MDTRSPLVRLLQDGYRGQARTLWKATRLGLVDPTTRALTPAGVAYLEREAPGPPPVRKDAAAVALGARGGRARSARKTAAARANGRRGGWPKGRPRRPTDAAPPD